MAGGRVDWEVSRDILIYDSGKNKWTKTGELCRGRSDHAMSLVPVETEIEDQCIFDMNC